MTISSSVAGSRATTSAAPRLTLLSTPFKSSPSRSRRVASCAPGQLLVDLLELAREPLLLAAQRLLERAAPLVELALALDLGVVRLDREQEALVGLASEAVLALGGSARAGRAPRLAERQLGPRLGERAQRGEHAPLRIEQVQVAALRQDLEQQLEGGLGRLERERELAILVEQAHAADARGGQQRAQPLREGGRRGQATRARLRASATRAEVRRHASSRN